MSAVSFGPKRPQSCVPARTTIQHPCSLLMESRTRGSTCCAFSQLCTSSSTNWQATLGKSHFSCHHHLFSQWGHSFKSVSLAQTPVFLVLTGTLCFFESPVLLGNLVEISQQRKTGLTGWHAGRQNDYLPLASLRSWDIKKKNRNPENWNFKNCC